MSHPMPRSKLAPRPELAETCPHLGVEDDQQTCLAYPSPWNLCYRAQPARVVRLSHQRKACLSHVHSTCPVFQKKAAEPLPVELRGKRRGP